MNAKIVSLIVVAISALASVSLAQTNSAASSNAAPPAPPYPDPPATLPGKGLAQHDFLYSGEFDTRNTNQTMFLVKGGKVVWTYQIPIKDRNNNLSEYSDMHRCSNGDIVFAMKTGWRKIDKDGKTLFNYECRASARTTPAN